MNSHNVLVYRSDLLPLSETFILQQVSFYKRYHGILVGSRTVPGLTLSGVETKVLWRNKPNLWNRFSKQLLFRYGIAVPSAVEELRKLGGSLVHVHFGTDAVDIWPLVRTLGVPVLITLHGYDISISPEWWESGRGGERMRGYPQKLRELMLEPQVWFIAVSEAIRQRALTWGMNPERIVVRKIGIDIASFSPGPIPVAARQKRVLFVGRLVEKKGCTYLIKAFERLLQELPDSILVIAGTGPEMSKLRDQAYALGGAIRFLGACDDRAVRAEISVARVLCLPSITAENGDSEGLGMVLLEAQASGVPVVTPAIGGSTEAMINGQTGFQFAERDIAALTEHLIRLLVDDTCASAFSRQARDFIVESFDIRNCSEKLENFYDDVIDMFRSNSLSNE